MIRRGGAYPAPRVDLTRAPRPPQVTPFEGDSSGRASRAPERSLPGESQESCPPRLSTTVFSTGGEHDRTIRVLDEGRGRRGPCLERRRVRHGGEVGSCLRGRGRRRPSTRLECFGSGGTWRLGTQAHLEVCVTRRRFALRVRGHAERSMAARGRASHAGSSRHADSGRLRLHADGGGGGVLDPRRHTRDAVGYARHLPALPPWLELPRLA